MSHIYRLVHGIVPHWTPVIHRILEDTMLSRNRLCIRREISSLNFTAHDVIWV